MFLHLWIFFSLIYPATALETSFIKIQEPKDWTCERLHAEYVCRSQNPLERKESLLVIKAKLSGRGDNNQSFFESLRRPLTMTSSAGKSGLSTVYSAQKIKIQDHPWVRALHLNSKSANYFTEYLVTVNGDIAISVELTFHQSRYNKYIHQMNEIIKNISLVDNIATQRASAANEPRPVPTPTAPFIGENQQKEKRPLLGLNMHLMIYIGIGLLLIFGFLLIRR
ncbi:MAG: hypothetical protein H6625_10360 [Bdellovibrionaceae bacterium]|nr:hypothetical protein [Pseudobdellovibrionaceae bacterium]